MDSYPVGCDAVSPCFLAFQTNIMPLS